MLKNLSFVIFVLAMGQSIHGQVIQLGKCPKVEYLTEFDLAAYTGIWYEYAKYPLIFELGQKCVTANYTALENDKVGVRNSAVEILTNLPVSIEGYANVLGPGRLAVVFGNTNSNDPQQNYAVLGTDYNSWALVYNCDNLGGPFRIEALWILTRDQIPTEEQVANAKQVMNQNGISEDFLTITEQNNCPGPDENN